MTFIVEPSSTPYLDRETLCLAGSEPGLATHAGEDDFAVRLRRNYQSDESNMAEQLIHFKERLSKLDGEAFWTHLMEGMTEICHSQFAFVSKRILLDDHVTAVEMPKIGEEGSCLMAVALYYNDGHEKKGLLQDYKYYAWSCPCAYMKHDKVFLIAEKLSEFLPAQSNPNHIPIDAEAYLGVPLFADGKCYAHFGMMWTRDGLQKKSRLSWALIEMFLHSLEDMITAKLLVGQGFARSGQQLEQQSSQIIPQGAITVTQSLKVYARSLSHELRTPMQGVVGMLDLMHATVQEQLEGQNSHKIRQIFQYLKSSIEVVQDSSKRAVEAADNVVQAYDLNMQVPETPTHQQNSPLAATANASYFDVRPSMTDGSQIVNPNKRKRAMESAMNIGNATKVRHTGTPSKPDRATPASPLRRTMDIESVSPKRRSPPLAKDFMRPEVIALPPSSIFTPETDRAMSTPSFRQSNIRELLPIVINDSLRVGGRPDFAVSEPIDLGERIEVKIRSSNGDSSSKTVSWTVTPDVPHSLCIDERDLTKLIGAVFLNSLKFTDHGEINIDCYLNDNKKSVIIRIKDTGLGIPSTFQPELFKAFSKEDDSITRSREGLGLGLMVAKGLARRVGGDLTLIRSSVDMPDQGSEFEIRFPVEGNELRSRPSTPFYGFTESSVLRSEPHTIMTGLTDTPATTPPRTLSPPVLRALSPGISTPPPAVKSDPAIASTNGKSLATPRTNLGRRLSSTPKNNPKPDRQLAAKYPLTFVVAEDNKINRKLLVQMLNTLGYKDVHEAFDGQEAVRVVGNLMEERRAGGKKDSNTKQISKNAVDVILMDLWMPIMDGYQASERILEMYRNGSVDDQFAMDTGFSPPGMAPAPPTILAVSADVTDAAIDRATKIGMSGYMSKPFKVLDLQKLILEFCVKDLVSASATAA